MSPNKKIRYGIIGFGAFAERVIMPAIRSSKNSELVAIQKRSLDMAKWKAQEHNVTFYFDSVEALAQSSEVDAVFIVSANSQHHKETLISAKEKKHVLVEKPMAINLLQANEMLIACENAGVRFMVGHMLRFSPLINRMKEIIESGILGEITFAQSHFIYDVTMSQRKWVLNKEAAGGGPLFDIAVHSLDTIRYILNGDNVESISSFANPKPTDSSVEKSNLLSLQFSKGTIASIFTSYETSYRQSFIELFGTKGSLSAYNFTPSNVYTTLEIKKGMNGSIEKIEREEFNIPDLYKLEVEHFSDSILNNSQIHINPRLSLQNQEILEKAVFLSKK